MNRVGAISDGLIKHGISKLKDVLGSALITTHTNNKSTKGTLGPSTRSIYLIYYDYTEL